MSVKVLLVDDDPAIASMLEFSLGLEGIELTTARDGQSGLEAALREQPDVVLLDWMMPKMNGIEVLKALRSQDGENPQRVIMCTAKRDDGDVWEGWQNGADYYLTKPFEVEELVDTIYKLASPAEALVAA